MKDLKENTAYNLIDLSDEQLQQVAIWFMENKNDTQLFSSTASAFKWIKEHIEYKDRLSKYKNSKHENIWGFRKTNYKEVNALELFDSKENSYPIQGKKESNGKCKFELDFDFIEAMSLRIENETKYKPYNWKLPLNTDELSNALLRHAIEVKKGNFNDNGELGHLMAIANNAMFLYYQLKNNK